MTVSHSDLLGAIHNGVVLTLKNVSPSYMARRATATDSVTGKLVCTDNEVYVRYWLSHNMMSIVNEITEDLP